MRPASAAPRPPTTDVPADRDPGGCCAGGSWTSCRSSTNVLVGDMSLVGPRPAGAVRGGPVHRPPSRELLTVRPGITDWGVDPLPRRGRHPRRERRPRSRVRGADPPPARWRWGSRTSTTTVSGSTRGSCSSPRWPSSAFRTSTSCCCAPCPPEPAKRLKSVSLRALAASIPRRGPPATTWHRRAAHLADPSPRACSCSTWWPAARASPASRITQGRPAVWSPRCRPFALIGPGAPRCIDTCPGPATGPRRPGAARRSWSRSSSWDVRRPAGPGAGG